MSRYDPKGALEAFLISRERQQDLARLQKEGLKRKMFTGSAAPTVIRDVQPPDAEAAPVTAPLCCFPLQAWIDKAEGLPPDIQALERNGTVLKAHVRPDGAVFLGLFEEPNQKQTGVVVFGAQGTPPATAIAVSQQYREETLAELDAIRAGREAAQAGTPVPTDSPVLVS